MPTQIPPETLQYAPQFFTACRQGSIETLQAPLEAGLPANLTNENGDTLLMLASYHGHAPLVSLLLAHGADPNRLNDKGQSPLAGAVYKNERDVVDALLAGGADPHVGQPTAKETARMFKNEEFERRFREEPGPVPAAAA
ncbi:uncharacterized protein RHOBADRAFT_54212 [Rhodotorula graminis WP1]|uniref:Uncharacterized protein n=1 Tax=Rhodotorula graminis (strain WP1) TaxID=578459 RepID=A0A194S1F7_RHOGW|nr:uncharacterized protein RHOBADRAFT_54212 [Rhodotorula graminis WP1]KPV74375.1 hypothetical protein RHOBADRAFT_54212 [Rhodotorula graminis WP1]